MRGKTVLSMGISVQASYDLNPISVHCERRRSLHIVAVEYMNTEQFLLEKWRALPPEKQQEVINFVEFLEFKKNSAIQPEAEPKSKPLLGEQLRKIREEIVTSGVPLLDWEGVEREKAERRGGYHEDAQ